MGLLEKVTTGHPVPIVLAIQKVRGGVFLPMKIMQHDISKHQGRKDITPDL